jgi:hypothetical protein
MKRKTLIWTVAAVLVLVALIVAAHHVDGVALIRELHGA